MLALPQRDAFVARADFVAAATKTFDELVALYQASPIEKSLPEWTQPGQGATVFQVKVPSAFTVIDGPLQETSKNLDRLERAALNSVLVHMIERRKNIKQLARLKTGDDWFIWIETD